MSVEKTLSIIKPDAVKKNVIGEIYTRFEKRGLKIVAAKMLSLTTKEAESFYGEHKERPFFNDLVKFMTSGPVMVQVLEGENAVLENRNLMGATDPQEAKIGTIRIRELFHNLTICRPNPPQRSYQPLITVYAVIW